MPLAPHWLDGVIDDVLEAGDPAVIAQAIANSPKFIDAIKAGLAEAVENAKAPKKTPAGKSRIGGLGPAQIVRTRVVDAIASSF